MSSSNSKGPESQPPSTQPMSARASISSSSTQYPMFSVLVVAGEAIMLPSAPIVPLL